jgi:hypothetical protein
LPSVLRHILATGTVLSLMKMDSACSMKLRFLLEPHRVISQRTKSGVFWYVTPCDSCKNWRFGGTYTPPSSGRAHLVIFAACVGS